MQNVANLFKIVSHKFRIHDFILIKLIFKRFFLPSKVIRRLQHISHQRRTGVYRKSMKVKINQNMFGILHFCQSAQYKIVSNGYKEIVKECLKIVFAISPRFIRIHHFKIIFVYLKSQF
jgi:hypothetical protein